MVATVNLCTGGLNSLLHWWLFAPFRDTVNLYVDYGQPKAYREKAAIASLATLFGMRFLYDVVPGAPLPVHPDGIVVPCRNAALLAVAAAHVVARDPAPEHAEILFGVPDGETISDKSQAFMEAMSRALSISCAPQPWTPHGTTFLVESRLRGRSKGALIREYLDREGPAEALWMTSSCNDGANPHAHCGTCESCIKRKAAFAEAGIPDRTKYAVSERA